ncbi:MAG: hypothetical protein WC612_06280 [Bdellovibrionales bacterium]|jgi:hypothetical protein
MMPLIIMRQRGKPVIDWSFLGSALPSGLTFTRASAATRFDSSGVMQSAAANEPRFDYDPVTHEANGLLIEASRQNVFLNSNAPATQNITVTAQVYTVSFYGSGSLVLSGAHSATVAGNGSYPLRRAYTFTPSAGTLTVTVSGDVQKAQLEAGAFATSFITTSGSAATRAADLLSTISLPWFNVAQGAFLVEFVLNGAAAGGNNYTAAFSDGTTNNLIATFFSASTINAQGILVAAGVSKTSAGTSGALGLGSLSKQALTYKTASNSMCFNGVLDGSSTLGGAGLPSSITCLALGNRVGGAYIPTLYLRRFQYWNRALDNIALQRITQ